MPPVTISLDLLKQVREFADWFVKFPNALVEAVMGPVGTYHEQSARIRRYAELGELREIGKIVQRLYLTKGSIVDWMQSVQRDADPQEVQYVRDMCSEVVEGLVRLERILRKLSFSNTALAVDAARQIPRGLALYRELRDLPDAALMNDEAMVEVAKLVERMGDAGSDLISRLDTHRRVLDGSH